MINKSLCAYLNQVCKVPGFSCISLPINKVVALEVFLLRIKLQVPGSSCMLMHARAHVVWVPVSGGVEDCEKRGPCVPQLINTTWNCKQRPTAAELPGKDWEYKSTVHNWSELVLRNVQNDIL